MLEDPFVHFFCWVFVFLSRCPHPHRIHLHRGDGGHLLKMGMVMGRSSLEATINKVNKLGMGLGGRFEHLQNTNWQILSCSYSALFFFYIEATQKLDFSSYFGPAL